MEALDNSQIRQEIKQKRRALSEVTYQAMSLSCFENLKKLLTHTQYQNIGIYVSINHEVDTNHIIEYLWSLGKAVYVPLCEKQGIMNFFKISAWEDLGKGRFGILEPKNSRIKNNDLDVVIIPLVGYDENGFRLGMGGGYYDRFFAESSALAIGLAYSFQQIVFFTQKHDLKFDYLVNEKEIISYK